MEYGWNFVYGTHNSGNLYSKDQQHLSSLNHRPSMMSSCVCVSLYPVCCCILAEGIFLAPVCPSISVHEQNNFKHCQNLVLIAFLDIYRQNCHGGR